MSTFASLPTQERIAFLQEAAARLNVLPAIVEKDFWVCWMLGRIFSAPGLAEHVVFKGGTSLSKVFGAIHRFSEDIDLSVAPELLGLEESVLDEAPSASQRRKRFEKLESVCAERVEGTFQKGLETIMRGLLGSRQDKQDWLSYQLDVASNSPALLFAYPTVLATDVDYIAPTVKVEFGSLTDQRPTGTHRIQPLLAEISSAHFEDFQIEVVSLEVERTFWEKVTILHAEYHRPSGQAMRDRFARHYADVVALWQHPAKHLALSRLDLLERVVTHKLRFFASSWASYDTAKPGSLRLRPPAHREIELARDYAKMQGMFLTTPLSFDKILSILEEAERVINAV